MKRLTLATCVAGLGLALAACASDDVAPAQNAPQLRATQAPGGEWVVREDFAVESVGTPTSPYLGQPVTLDSARAIDPAGRLCKVPAYWESTGTAAESLGLPAQPQAAVDTAPRPVITITCDNEPFAVLVSQPDGTWLTRQGSWVLRLARPEPKPLAAAAPAEAAPAPVPAAEPAPAAKAKPDPRTLVYLASYRTEARAKAGFATLSKVSPILARQQPITQTVELGKKGKWVRLYGMAADESERAAICKQVGKRVDECGARNRE